MRRELYSTCDGSGLKEISTIPIASSWVLDGTKLLSGRSYINSIQIRTNTLYSRSRGRKIDHQCSQGCTQPETLNHILQNCYASHKPRIARHDKLVEYLKRGAEQHKFLVQSEPSFATKAGILKPNLVLIKGDNYHLRCPSGERPVPPRDR
ncbi:hypothetical protein JTE90_007433 [Oedothorax gibbosus]|uniref:Retrovirus-related Pol polyprotein from type-1 retrotransposable element R2 n=1 Tax=Oedothorax gibbosus TaxID=931172 RepID=A0AAV6UPM8_9ARAC|nr:hypothetical protein JTE90_007433 [Oedothorax gibbosus]